MYPFFYDVRVRSPVRTDAGRGGKESDVGPSGEGYVIAEFISAVNRMTARTFRESKKRVFLSTKF